MILPLRVRGSCAGEGDLARRDRHAQQAPRMRKQLALQHLTRLVTPT